MAGRVARPTAIMKSINGIRNCTMYCKCFHILWKKKKDKQELCGVQKVLPCEMNVKSVSVRIILLKRV